MSKSCSMERASMACLKYSFSYTTWELKLDSLYCKILNITCTFMSSTSSVSSSLDRSPKIESKGDSLFIKNKTLFY